MFSVTAPPTPGYTSEYELHNYFRQIDREKEKLFHENICNSIYTVYFKMLTRTSMHTDMLTYMNILYSHAYI